MGDFATFFFANAFWIWMGLAALLLGIEIATSTGWLLWPAGSSAAVAFFTFAPFPWPVDVLAFVILTVASTLLGRRYMPRTIPEGPDINDPHARIIGHVGVAASAIAGGHGRVLVDGKEWAAESEADLPTGTRVTVVSVLDGARLKVKPA